MSEGRSFLVLAVDDESQTLAAIVETLAPAGYACRTCQTTDEALTLAAQTLPDLVLCAARVGEVGGRDLCERMRELPGLAHVAVMLLSATQGPDVIRRSHLDGGGYSLRKPFSPAALAALVARTLGASHRDRLAAAVGA